VDCYACQRNQQGREYWGPGPWQNEPDGPIAFDHRGLSCFVHRGNSVWCGYVGVPEGHLWHGKEYGEIDVGVHGGLTFAEDSGPHGIKDGRWYIGFDCGHAFDLSPFLHAVSYGRLPGSRPLPDGLLEGFGEGEHYWTMQEAIEETKRLAEQVAGQVER